MNRDLLEALGAIAAALEADARTRHPGLFPESGVKTVTDEDRAMVPVLFCIEDLLEMIDHALDPTKWDELALPEPPPLPDLPDDDIPF